MNPDASACLKSNRAALALKRGLELARDASLSRLVIESDSLTLVKAINSIQLPLYKVGNIIKDIAVLIHVLGLLFNEPSGNKKVQNSAFNDDNDNNNDNEGLKLLENGKLRMMNEQWMSIGIEGAKIVMKKANLVKKHTQLVMQILQNGSGGTGN
ncbi:hypothetical protein ACOSQ3_031497 [Xanthoceras sorbifolium]